MLLEVVFMNVQNEKEESLVMKLFEYTEIQEGKINNFLTKKNHSVVVT